MPINNNNSPQNFITMKKIIYLVFISILLVSCFKKPGLEILFDKEYVELNLSTFQRERQTQFYEQTMDGVSVKDSIIITYSGKPKGNPINVGCSVEPITRNALGDTVKAIEGTHYRVISRTASVPANKNFAKLPIEILDDNLVLDKVYVFNVKIVSADVPVSDYYFNVDFSFKLLCPFNILNFSGDYRCIEPGYNGSPYDVTVQNVNSTTIRVLNFWDSGLTVNYRINVAEKTITIPEQPLGTTRIVVSPSPGTYDPCTGTFIVKYIITTTTGVEIESNTHTFIKY